MKEKKGLSLALVGTTSMRGKEMRNVLDKKRFPLKIIRFFDPDVGAEYNKLTEFDGEPRVIQCLDKDSLINADLVFLAADKKINRKFGRLATQNKFLAIDLSESFCDEEKVPVVVAGVNDGCLQRKKTGLISNPHPVAIILSHLFHALIQSFGILKAIAFVLQPVSAFEGSGIDELASQSVAMMNSESFLKKVFKEQIAFNFLCSLEPDDKSGFSSVEKQIISEIKRVLNRTDFPLSLSLVQAPVFHTYSIMIFLELERKADIELLKRRFKENSCFKLAPAVLSSPVSSISMAGDDRILVGQIKREKAFPNSFWIWIVADNLTRGSAVNAFEIAKKIYSFSSD